MPKVPERGLQDLKLNPTILLDLEIKMVRRLQQNTMRVKPFERIVVTEKLIN